MISGKKKLYIILESENENFILKLSDESTTNEKAKKN